MTQSLHEITGEMTSTAELNETERYQLMASERRRTTLDVLSERITPVTLDELATAIAERESRPDTTGEPDVDRIRSSLHHKHLPKMADMGVIKYDADTHQVQ